MDIDEIASELNRLCQAQHLRPTKVAREAQKRHPELNIGHQWLLNIIKGKNKTRTDGRKLAAILEVLGMDTDTFRERINGTRADSAAVSPALARFLAVSKAMAAFVIANREHDAQLSAFAVEITSVSPAVFGALPREQLAQIRMQSEVIAKRCAQVSLDAPAAQTPVVNP